MKRQTMKQKSRRPISFLIVLTMLVISIFSMPVAASAAGEPALYVAVGDSVVVGTGLGDATAAAINGHPAKVTAALASITGETIIPQVLAADGLTTTTLLQQLTAVEGNPVSKAAIGSAKYITLNIGGNNVLGPLIQAICTKYGVLDPNDLATSPPALATLQTLTFGAFEVVDQQAIYGGATAFTTEFPQVISKIKAIAPNAKLAVSTIYNPFPEGVLEISAQGDGLLVGMNQVIAVGSATNAYKVADVYTAIKTTSPSALNFDLSSYPPNLDIHPNVAGQTIIANLYIEALSPFTFTGLTANITGTAKVGEVLTATAVSAPNATYTYQWSAAGTAIAGATAATYTPVAADIGKTLTVTVKANLPWYTEATVTSDPTAAVITDKVPAKPTGTQLLKGPAFTKAQKSLAAKAHTSNKKAVTKVAKVAKKAKAGKKLTVSAKAIKGFKATYQWYRSGKAIAKATKKTYKLTKADKGKKLTLKVSYTTTKKATKTDATKATAQYKPTKTYTYKIGKIKK
jgi:lysophospholipase L1-like esterase